MLNDSQKAEIVVKDYAGNVISPFKYTAAVEPAGVVRVQTGSPQWVIADAPGTATLTIAHQDGRTGTLDIEVTAAPLVVSLGTPVAK